MKKTLLAASLAVVAFATHAEPVTYNVEPTHTFVLFEASHFGTSTVRGRFDKKDGSVTIDRAAKTGKAEITIDMSSVSTGVPMLDKHLKSADFFNADANPTAKFVSDKVSFDGDKVASLAGQLTLNGKTQPVTLTAVNFNCYQNPMLKREVCGGNFDTTIARSDYDMKYGLPNIPDKIHLLITIEAVKQ